jgi:hypothetical protein
MTTADTESGQEVPAYSFRAKAMYRKDWMEIDVFDVTRYIGDMNERCHAVIDAKGGHTKW